ncbi:hypothetical protein C0995_008664 [Termitomyces sp. Mi166|nr:hypothetical protein C0995_008664 [Termitomyces sp. Mi166\
MAKCSAWHIMKPEKNCDGYFSSDDTVEQANEAIDIMTDDYLEYKHVMVYDNIPSRFKHSKGAISAKKMPKSILKDERNWLIEVIKRTPDRKPVYNPDSTLWKIKIPMRDGTLPNGQPQPLYFDKNSEHPRVFKGMDADLD